MASRMTDQAPDYSGLGFAFLMAIVLTVAPTILAVAIGGIAGGRTGIGADSGILIGIGSGIIGTVLAWGVVGTGFFLFLNYDIHLHPYILISFVFTFLGAGVVAPICISWIISRKARQSLMLS